MVGKLLKGVAGIAFAAVLLYWFISVRRVPANVVAQRQREEMTAGDSVAQQFTQRFYSWYEKDSPYETTVRDSGRYFAPSLLAALRADLAASKANSEEIVGLDWDPFLASQDPCPPYRAGATTHRADTVRIAIRAACGDSSRPAVIADIVFISGTPVFSDFEHGDERGRLTSDLRELQASRDSTARARPSR